MRFYWERVEASRNFANKVWNASRFIMMNMPEEGIDLNNKPEQLTDADKWILSKLNTLVKDVTDNMEKYELGIAADKIYEFIWEEFCDWYIEMVKPRLYSETEKYIQLDIRLCWKTAGKCMVWTDEERRRRLGKYDHI